MENERHYEQQYRNWIAELDMYDDAEGEWFELRLSRVPVEGAAEVKYISLRNRMVSLERIRKAVHNPDLSDTAAFLSAAVAFHELAHDIGLHQIYRLGSPAGAIARVVGYWAEARR